MSSDIHHYDTLLKFLHEGKVSVDNETLKNTCWIISKELYQKVQEIKDLQNHLAGLQIANTEFRNSFGLQFINSIKRKVLRQPKAPDLIQELNRCIADKQLNLNSLLDPMETSDLYFQQYRRCDEQYIRIRSNVLPSLAKQFFEVPRIAEIETVLHRFRNIREVFRDFHSDPRILGLVAIISTTTPDFDTEEFFAWDTHMLNMLYGKNVALSHPMTYDRFLIHAILYSLPYGTIADRYIGFRIAWEMFRDKYAKHFDYKLRALMSAAHLLRDLEPFPNEEKAFKEFYQRKLERYWQLMKSIHHRVRVSDEQRGKGTSAKISDLESELAVLTLAKIGIPDLVFVIAARLVGFPAAISAIYERLSELFKSFDKMNKPILIASILADTPLYFIDRKDQRDSLDPNEPGTFIRQLRERIREANQLNKSFGWSTINAAIVALQPGPVESSIKIMEELSSLLSDIPKVVKKLVIPLLMDGIMPMTQNRRFVYELYNI